MSYRALKVFFLATSPCIYSNKVVISLSLSLSLSTFLSIYLSVCLHSLFEATSVPSISIYLSAYICVCMHLSNSVESVC